LATNRGLKLWHTAECLLNLYLVRMRKFAVLWMLLGLWACADDELPVETLPACQSTLPASWLETYTELDTVTVSRTTEFLYEGDRFLGWTQSYDYSNNADTNLFRGRVDTTLLTYAPNNALLSLTEQNVLRFQTDSFPLVVELTYHRSFTYNGVNKVISEITDSISTDYPGDINFDDYYYDYDLQGRLIQIRKERDGLEFENTQFAYQEDGNIRSVTTGSFFTSYREFDGQDNPFYTLYQEAGFPLYKEQYQRYSPENLERVRHPDGQFSNFDYEYDIIGRLIAIFNDLQILKFYCPE